VEEPVFFEQVRLEFVQPLYRSEIARHGEPDGHPSLRDGSGSTISALLEVLGERPGPFSATDGDRAWAENRSRSRSSAA
jgi:hypothetical protein